MNVFIETPRHAFGQSELLQRGLVQVCPDGVTEFSRFIGEHPTLGVWGGSDCPNTRAGGKWRIKLKFRCFVERPAFNYYSWAPGTWPPKEVRIAFLRYYRNPNPPPQQGFAIGSQDPFLTDQWIENRWVQGRATSYGPTRSDIGPPWQLPLFATGQLGELPGVPSTFSGIHPDYFYLHRWPISSSRSGVFGLGLPGRPRGSVHYFACGEEITAKIPWEDLVAGFIWEREFTVPAPLYCNPAFAATCWVPGQSETGGAWTFPPNTSENPDRFAWILTFDAKRYPALVAAFSVNRRSNREYQFTDISLGEIVNRSWNFGDGTTAGNVVSPTHTFPGPGLYTVTLTVTDVVGEVDVFAIEIAISSITPNFTILPATGDNGDVFTFTDQSQSSLPIVSRRWSFGDGESSDEVSPTHVYSAGGLKVVTLNLFDSNGAQNSITKQLNVVQYKADFSAISVIDSGLRRYTCNGILSTSAHAIVSYQWSAPGGTISGVFGSSATIRFPLGIVAQITLTITNAVGRVATVTKTFNT